jgi:hypothetical protein
MLRADAGSLDCTESLAARIILLRSGRQFRLVFVVRVFSRPILLHRTRKSGAPLFCMLFVFDLVRIARFLIWVCGGTPKASLDAARDDNIEVGFAARSSCSHLPSELCTTG